MTLFLCTISLLLQAVVWATALVVLLSFSVAWYERANAEPELIRQRFSGRGIGLALWLMAQETACLLLTFLLRPLGWPPERSHTGGAGEKPPVILLHGLFQNRSCLYGLALRLRRAGYHQVYSINTPPWRDIETLTEILARKVDEIRLELKVEQVILVGHSMGGLIGRNYIQHRGGAGRVSHLVTLGSPHSGSKLAPFAVSNMGLSLLPGSEFLRSFNQASLPPETPITAIYSRHDNLVLPLHNARLEGAENLELAGMGHTAMLFHPEVVDALLQTLGEKNHAHTDR